MCATHWYLCFDVCETVYIVALTMELPTWLIMSFHVHCVACYSCVGRSIHFLPFEESYAGLGMPGLGALNDTADLEGYSEY